MEDLPVEKEAEIENGLLFKHDIKRDSKGNISGSKKRE